MKRLGWILIAVCGLCVIGLARGPEALHFPIHRFSISPLEGPTHGATSVLLTMMLPASGGFAPNVNVVAQSTAGTIDNYIAATKREIEQNGFKLVQEDKVDDHTGVFEYTGTLQNRPLHWYTRASLKGREVLLVTATATEQQWPSSSAQLRDCVDSFQRDEGQ